MTRAERAALDVLPGPTSERLRAAGVDLGRVAAAAAALAACFRSGGKVLLFGNGGSAADAQHMSAEFVGRFLVERPALPAVALTTDTSALTALANDFGFERVFARQIEALGRPGDVAVAISTSGRSANVVAGADAAREAGMRSIGVLGSPGSPLEELVDVAITVASDSVPSIQETHLAIEHALCGAVEALLFGPQVEGVSGSEPQTPSLAAAKAVSGSEPQTPPLAAAKVVSGSEPQTPPLAAAKVVSGSEPQTRSQAAAKVVDWERLLALREEWRRDGRRVVWTNGCFDLLHVGHVRSLEAARGLGDVLVVGVNGDASVRRLKGDGRPLVPVEQRVEIVAALEPVDHVVVFDEPTPEQALERLRPEVHTKGADYAGRDLPERAVVEAYGGSIELLPLVPEVSTTELARRLRDADG